MFVKLVVLMQNHENDHELIQKTKLMMKQQVY